MENPRNAKTTESSGYDEVTPQAANILTAANSANSVNSANSANSANSDNSAKTANYTNVVNPAITGNPVKTVNSANFANRTEASHPVGNPPLTANNDRNLRQNGNPPKSQGGKANQNKITRYFDNAQPCSNRFPSQEKNTSEAEKKRTTRYETAVSPATSKCSNKYVTTVKQINLQKKKIANRTYFQELKFNEILLGQEPYFHKNKLVSVPTTHKSFAPHHKETPRVCIILPLDLGKISYSMTHFSNRDMITVRCNIKGKDVVFCSLYLGHEPNKPEIDSDTVGKMSKLVEFTKNRNLPLIMGADSNGHHVMWNSFKANDRRGILLAQLIEKWELNLANRGKSPTFVNSRGHKSIIDITMTNRKGNSLLSNWKVDPKTSLSDHKMISFDIDLGNKWETFSRNYQDMDASAFKKAVAKKLENRPFKAKIGKLNKPKSNIDSSVNYINKILTEALDEVCPLVKVTHRSKIPWSKEINTLKHRAKKAKSKNIKAQSSPLPLSEEVTKAIKNESSAAEKNYKKAIEEKDKQAYRDYCSNLSHPKKLARVPKNKRQPWEELNVLKKPDGSYTEDSEETLRLLAQEHFPDTPQAERLNSPQIKHESEDDKNIISKILNPTRLDRVASKLPLNKAPGPDGVRNKMIKAAWDLIKEPLRHIYNLCLTHAYCPKAWKTSKGMIIPKEGKDDYTNPRSYRIISLTSNLQKLLERMILDYLERDTGVDNKLTKNQFGFRKRKSTEAAIHRLTRKIEDAIQNGQFGLGVFLDVEGAFDNVKHSSIYKAMLEAKIPNVIANWIRAMLTDRMIVLTLHGISINRKIYKGCPQGGILSPLLWNLTLNTLLKNDNIDDDFVQAFADDLAILVQGFDLKVTMRDIVNRYLKIINAWCTENGVKLSTIKTKVIVFSTLNKKYSVRPITLEGETIEFSDEVKYLGVTYDKHLRWDTHIKNKCRQATKLLYMSRNFIAKTWGLTPARTRWLYKQVILPTVSYACFTWIHRLKESTNLRSLLEKVQKLATLQITGGLQKSPNITLDILAGVMPIEAFLQFKASKTSIRLKIDKHWNSQYSLASTLMSHAKYLDQEINKLGISKHLTLIDRTSHTTIDTTNFTVITKPPQHSPPESSLKIFTDGSLKKSPNLTGAGFTMIRNGRTLVDQSMSLGRLATINQCEMFAIYKAAELLVDADTQNQVIFFYSDSLSSLLKINKSDSISKLTIDTVELLNKLGVSNQVTLHKVAAHTGIDGNEKADKLAKSGAKALPTGPEPFLCISWNNVINELLNKARADTLEKLSKLKLQEASKTPIESYINRFGLNRMACKKKQSLRILTHMLTDQSWLNNSLSKRNPLSTPICQRCGETKETAQHFISECPAYAMLRICTFGIPYISLSQIIEEFGPGKLVDFINKTGRIKDNYFPPTV